MDFLSDMLNRFQGHFMTDVINNLKPYALGLFGSLILIDLILSTLHHLGDPDTFKKLCFNLLKYGAVLWVIMSFSTLTDAVFNSCVAIGGIAATGTTELTAGTVNAYPSEMAEKGFDCFWAFFGNLDNYLPDIDIGFWDAISILPALKKLLMGLVTWPVKIIVSIVVAFLILICFGVLAIEIFITLMEFYICAGVSVIFIPFAACKQTSFLTQKAISVIIGFGIKVIFLVLVIAVTRDDLMNIVESSSGELKELVGLLFTVSGLTFLAWQVPKIAMGFLGGSPSQGASGVIGSAMRAGGAVVGAAAGAAKAAGGLYQAAKAGAAEASAGGGGGVSKASKVAGGESPEIIPKPVSPAPLKNGSKTQSSDSTKGGDNNPSSLAPQKNESQTQRTSATGGGHNSPSSLAPQKNGGDATGSSGDTAPKTSKFRGALKGMGQYIASSTSFGQGMSDAENKAYMRDNMRKRLKSAGRTPTESGSEIPPSGSLEEIRRRNEDDDDESPE